MKRFFRAFFYGMILVIVGLASALMAMRFAIHGREVSVPKLVGLTAAQAQRIANDNGLQLWREERFYSSEVPEGRILSQLPTPGTRVRTGFLIRVAESLGPQKVEIPDLIGQSARGAELNLRRRGLEVGSVAQIPTSLAPADQVIAQNPTPDAQKVSAPAVNLLMSAPASQDFFVMPDFVGSKISQAVAAIRKAGLETGPITTAAAAVSSGEMAQAGTPQNTRPTTVSARAGSEQIITRQTPAPGQRVTAGMVVRFEVTAR